MTDTAVLPRLSIVVETSTWHSDGKIQLEDSLAAIRAQDYPNDRLQIVTVTYGPMQPYLETLDRFAITDRVAVPEGTGYYEAKRRGLEVATGEIVGFVDADNLIAPDWARQIVAPFREQGDVLAVLGRHHFRRAFLSRFWDMLWWDRSFEKEGPIDKIASANNVAFRRTALDAAWYPDPNRFRGTWERAMSDAVKRRGTIWFAPTARLTHDYEPGVRKTLLRAYARGYSVLATRAAYPRGIEGRIGPIRWLVPWLAFPALLAKDIRRVVSRSSTAGYSGAGRLQVPGLVAGVLVADVISLAGMVRSLHRKGHVEPP